MPSAFTRGRGRPKIPKVEKHSLRPEPPRKFPRGSFRGVYTGGPGPAPAWIITPTTSESEWFIFWALLQLLGPPGNDNWGYQISSNDGRTIIDFVIWVNRTRTAVRVQSERFHVATSARRQTYDRLQRQMLERSGYKVIDVYEEHFLHDKTGFAAIMVCKDMLRGIERPSPITYKTGMSRPTRK
jgi:hypothetical protein